MTEQAGNESEDNDECSPVEELAEQYLDRLRNGERPRISEYADAHPELAEDIHDVFRTLAMLEDLAPDHNDEGSVDSTLTTDAPTRLGEYRIVRELGRGGMGVVYEAEHGTMRRRVALKVLHTRASKSDHDLERFLREARSAGRLHHTNIVPVFEVGSDEDTHFYAMQCIRGQNLDLVIDDLKRLQVGRVHLTPDLTDNANVSAAQCLMTGRFQKSEVIDDEATEDCDYAELIAAQQATSPGNPVVDPPVAAGKIPNSSELSNVGEGRESYFHRVARVGLQVADALAYAHEQGVLHRDIKPSNLILDTVGIVWVTDFGLARSEGDNLTHTGDIVGTLRYMAPERFRGEADARSDIYSLGLTLYELSTLKYAFDRAERADLIRQVTREEAIRPRRVNPAIPRDLETIILKCIDREPGGRYRKAEAVAADLRLFLTDRPIQARRATFMEQSWRWCRRNPILASLVSSIIVLLAVIFYGALDFALETRKLNDELVSKRDLAERAFEAERKANADSRFSLYQSLFRQAQAERRNKLTGRLDECMAALGEASTILSELELPQEERKRERLLLRNEAVAAMGQTGVSLARSRMPESLKTRSIVYDHNYERYAISRGRIEIRRASDDELLQTAPQLLFRATDLVFSDDDRYLATIHRHEPAEPRFVRVWDLKEERTLAEVETPVKDICFSPSKGDDKAPHLAFISDSSTVTVYRSSNAQQPITHDYAFGIRGVCFVGEHEIAAVGDGPNLEIWSFEDGSTRSISTLIKGRRVKWSRKKNRVAVGYQNGTIGVFDLDGPGRRVANLAGHNDDVLNLSISPDGELAASTSWDGTTRIWDVRAQSELHRLENEVLHPGFSSDSRFLCCGDAAGQVRIYDISRHSPKRVYEDDGRQLRHHAVDFHPQKSNLAVAATGSHIEVWDLEKGRMEQFIKTDRTFGARFSDDGQRLMTSGRRGLRIWKVSTPGDVPWMEPIATDERFFTDYDTYYADAASDFSRFIFVNVDGRATIVESDKPKSPIHLATPSVHQVAISPDGKWAVTIQLSGRGLIIWNAENGERITELNPSDAATLVSFSRDGRWLIGNNTKGHFIWRVGTWEIEKHVARTTAAPGAVAISPDNRLLVVPLDRFSLQVLDGETLEPLLTLDTGDRRRASYARFSNDSERLAITSLGRFEVWDIPELRSRLRELQLDWDESSLSKAPSAPQD